MCFPPHFKYALKAKIKNVEVDKTALNKNKSPVSSGWFFVLFLSAQTEEKKGTTSELCAADKQSKDGPHVSDLLQAV